jgi:glutamate N-acetyltransferase/amino-acid N-acetyltransferase
MATPSPLAPERFPDLPPIAGVRLASAACGIRYQGRTDLMVAVLDPGTTVAGVLTRSVTHGAPVAWCRSALKHGKARALVVNSGNSIPAPPGAAAGDRDGAHRRQIAQMLPRDRNPPPRRDRRAPPADRILGACRAIARGRRWVVEAARAIATTDTFPRGDATHEDRRVQLHPQRIRQGLGMIAPDMATMLTHIFTDGVQRRCGAAPETMRSPSTRSRSTRHHQRYGAALRDRQGAHKKSGRAGDPRLKGSARR